MPVRKIERETMESFKPGWRRDRRTGRWYTYEIDYRDPDTGERRRRRGFVTEEEAKEFQRGLATSHELRRLGLVRGSVDLPELRDVLAARLGDLAIRRERVRSARVYRVFAGMFPDGFTVAHLRTRHFKEYAELRLSQGVKPETVNRELTAVRGALKAARVTFPALEDWEAPKGWWCAPAERVKRQRVIGEDEERKVLGWLREPRREGELEKAHLARKRTALIVGFALLTGLRHGEIVGVRKADVKKDELAVFRPKTKVWTVFPLTEEMRRIVGEASELFPGEYVFSVKGVVQGKTWTMLRQACEAVGVAYGRGSGLVLHSARHTFISRLMHAGVDIATIQSFSSHSDAGMVMKYSHATDETRRRALDALAGGSDEELERIWRQVREGEMDLETFKRQVSKN